MCNSVQICVITSDLYNLYGLFICIFLCNLGVGSEGTVGFSEPAQFCLECGKEVRMDAMQSNDRGWRAC